MSVSTGMPRTFATSPLVSPRTWQSRLHYGRFKRNSTALKPVIWFFQQIRVLHVQGSSESDFRPSPL